MKEDLNIENLVTFPSSKNFPPISTKIDVGNDPIEDLLAEIEGMELEYTSEPIEELDQDILSHRVFPRKKSLSSNLGQIENKECFIGKTTSLDKVLEVLRMRVDELSECHKRSRFYINEISINQK